ITLTSLLLSCGGGGSPAPSTPATPPTISSGFLSAAAINNANCSIYKITAAGAKGNKLTDAVSNQGVISFKNVNYSGRALIECSSGQYTDEATGNEKTSPILRTALNFIDGSKFAITPLTEISVQIDANLNNVINSHNDSVAKAFGLSGKNIVTILPTDINALDLSDDDAGYYATVLAMLSQLEADNTTEGNTLAKIIISLKADLIDGTLDKTTEGKLNAAFERLKTSRLRDKFNNNVINSIKEKVTANAVVTAFIGAKLVSVSSGSADKISVDWIEASGDDIQYEVHISTTNNFTPSPSTLKLTTQELSATITQALTANTKYYVVVVAKNTESSRPSNELSVTTAIKTAEMVTGLVVNTNQNLIAANNTITTKAAIQTDEIIFSTAEDSIQLKQVVNTTIDTNGNTIATTKDVTLRDVYK
ncbi:MAG: fibronectin type III domain-containing protein, partial [Gammaproteobacteria bacterium]|nr:fibronectin type III domain-containing protein [Gammaproteobacteria bacterium]